MHPRLPKGLSAVAASLLFSLVHAPLGLCAGAKHLGCERDNRHEVHLKQGAGIMPFTKSPAECSHRHEGTGGCATCHEGLLG